MAGMFFAVLVPCGGREAFFWLMNANFPEDGVAGERAVLGAAGVLADALCFRDPVAWDVLCFHGMLHAGRVPGWLVGRHAGRLGPLVARVARECGGVTEVVAERLTGGLLEASFLQRLTGTVDYQVRPVVGRLVAGELERRDWVGWWERAAGVVGWELQGGRGGAAGERWLMVPHGVHLWRAARRVGHESEGLRGLAELTARALRESGMGALARELEAEG